MLIATSNKPKQLLMISYIGKVLPEDITSHRLEVTALMAELSPGFRMLTDFTQMESLHADCIEEIGKMMELLDKGGAGFVVRVIPDPSMDPGWNILGIFHYRKDLQVMTCQTLQEAIKLLEL